MSIRTIRIGDDLWEAVKQKAGLIPVAAIVRRLLEKWLKGEIDLD